MIYNVVIWALFGGLIAYYFLRLNYLAKRCKSQEATIKQLLHEQDLASRAQRWTAASGLRLPSQIKEDYGFSDPNEPTADELAEVYRSLGCAVPPSIERKIAERDKVLDEILADLDALGDNEEKA